MNASRDSAAWTEEGGGGLPTLGVVTVTFGPRGAPAVHAVRPAQQQISSHRPIPCRIIVPFRAAAHALRSAASGLVRAARTDG